MSLNNRKNSTLIVIVVGIVFLGIILFQFINRDEPSPYQRKIQTERAQKDGEFRTSANSPLKEADRAAFEGLAYFPPQEAYRLEATLAPAPGSDTMILQTTQGTDRKLLRAGTLSFTFLERSYSLTAFRYLDGPPNTLFIPFKDLSSGKSTYGGGRYIETVVQPGKPIYVDFNRAYNPYCVYNEEYVCPLPPPENKLRLEILAGERLAE